MDYEIYMKNIMPALDKDIIGNSPPSLFIGRYGYPKVSLGPLVPPEYGDTSIYGQPEKWINKSIDDILMLTSKLVYGHKRLDVSAARREDRFYLELLDIAISKYSPEVEMHLNKRPYKYIVFSEDSTPFGPSGPLENLRLGTLRIDYRIDRLVSDYDMKAEDAVYKLYKYDIPITTIQRVFSIGGLGVRKNRKIVPTRWSITAIDDIIGKRLLKYVRTYPLIDEYLVFEYSALENRYIVLLMPRHWSYEFLEAWYPGTFWNRYAGVPIIYSDYELYRGRTDYAEIGGCYYAARLATLEYLTKVNRQATAIIFREAYPGYLFPVGVWSVRESVRRAYRNPPTRFRGIADSLEYVFSKLKISKERWFNASYILGLLLKQEKLSKYLG
jgi:hypothetical protein